MLLLCSSCAALVLLLFLSGALRGAAAFPPSPCLILTPSAEPVFKWNCIFLQILSRWFPPALARNTFPFCNLPSAFCFPPRTPRHPLSRELNIAVARPARSRVRVWAFCNMQAIEAKAKMDNGTATRFGVLKQRLLLQRLNEVPDSATHALIIRQANEAAFLSCLTLYPLLTFPCLFEERAVAATEQARRQAHLYWNGLDLQAPARAA